jgi:RHS repeat-associated protein
MRISFAGVAKLPLITTLLVALVATNLTTMPAAASAETAQTAKSIQATLQYPGDSTDVTIQVNASGFESTDSISLLKGTDEVQTIKYGDGSGLRFTVTPPVNGTDTYTVVNGDVSSSELQVTAGVGGYQVSYSLDRKEFGAGDETPILSWTSNTSLDESNGYYALFVYDKLSGDILYMMNAAGGGQQTASGSMQVPRFKEIGSRNYGIAIAKWNYLSNYSELEDIRTDQSFTITRKSFELTAELDKNELVAGESTPVINAQLNQSLITRDYDWNFYLVDSVTGEVLGWDYGNNEGKASLRTPNFIDRDSRTYSVVIAEVGHYYGNRSDFTDVRAESSTFTVTRKAWTLEANLTVPEFEVGGATPYITVTANQSLAYRDSDFSVFLVDDEAQAIVTEQTGDPYSTTFRVPWSDETTPKSYSVYIAEKSTNYWQPTFQTLRNIQAISKPMSIGHKEWTIETTLNQSIYTTESGPITLVATTNQPADGNYGGNTRSKWMFTLVDVETNTQVIAWSYMSDGGKTTNWEIPRVEMGETRKFRVYISERDYSSNNEFLKNVRVASDMITVSHKPWDATAKLESKPVLSNEEFAMISVKGNQSTRYSSAWCYFIEDVNTGDLVRSSWRAQPEPTGEFILRVPQFADTLNRTYKVHLASCGYYPSKVNELENEQWHSQSISVERKPWTVAFTKPDYYTAEYYTSMIGNQPIGGQFSFYVVDETTGLVVAMPRGSGDWSGGPQTAFLEREPGHFYRGYVAYGGNAIGDKASDLKYIQATTDSPASLDWVEAGGAEAYTKTGGGSELEDCTTACAADPINTFTGEHYEDNVDLSTSGVLAPNFKRSYSSSNVADTKTAFGKGWRSNFDQKIETPEKDVAPKDAGELLVTLSNGSQAYFAKSGTGYITYARTKAELKYIADGNRLELTNKAAQTVSVFDGDSGRLIQIRDKNGNQLNLDYGDSALLQSVVASNGSRLDFNYNAAGLMTSATDGSRTATYSYDGKARLTKVSLPLGLAQEYGYNSADQIVTMKDLAGVTTTNTFDSEKRVVKQENSAGVKFTFDYSGNDRVITDSLGVKKFERYSEDGKLMAVTENYQGDDVRTRSYTYTGKNQLSTITWEDKKTEYMFYDANGNVVKKMDADGATTLATYTDAGLPLSITLANGATTYFSYDENGNPTKTVDPMGNATEFKYSARGLQTEIVDATGNKSSFEYTPTDLVAKAMKSNGAVSEYSYSSNGDLVSAKNPVGATVSQTVDVDGKPLVETDANGGKTTYGYDELQRLVSTTYPDGGKETYAYDEAGNLTATKDPAGSITKFDYDVVGQLKTSTLESGAVTKYSYNNYGEKVKETDALGNETRFEYSKRGFLSKVISPEGKETQYSYSAGGKLLKERNANGEETVYSYDPVGNLIKLVDAEGAITSFEYSLGNQLLKQIYPDGTYDSYTYDALGRNVSFQDAAGKVAAYTYDAVGNRVASTESGVSKTYEYTLDGRLAKETNQADGTYREFSYDKAGNNLTQAYSDGLIANTSKYDSMGRLTEVNDGTASTDYTYDKLGRLSAKIGEQGRIGYAYDASSNLTGIEYPSGAKAHYSYDKLGQLLEVKRDEQLIAKYAYDKDGQKKSMELSGDKISFTYDPTGRLLTKNSGKIKQEYSYNKLGNTKASQLTFSLPNDETAKRSSNYTLDSRQRLSTINKESTDGDEEPSSTSGSYTFDSANNMLSDYKGATHSLTAESQLTNIIDGDSQTDFAYSVRGELESKKVMKAGVQTSSADYSYDIASRLVEANVAANPPNTGSKTYEYSSEGLLGGTETTVGDSPKLNETYLWDTTSTVPALLARTANGVTTEYLYGVDSTPIAAFRNGNAEFYATDRQGSLIGALGENGELKTAVSYSEYGVTDTVHGKASALTFGYTGALRDHFTSNYYLVNRFYDPATSRFLTVDPALTGTHSAYSYVGGNPLNYSDPLGLLTWGEVADFAVGAADSYTLGFAGKLVEAVAPGSIDHCSASFIAGALIGDVVGYVLPPGSGVARAGIKATLNVAPALTKFGAKFADNLRDAFNTGEHAFAKDSGSFTFDRANEDLVYRALAKTDNPMDGIIARAPNANRTPLSHIAGLHASPWISTTKDIDIAMDKYNSGNGVIEIDLNKVKSRIVDLRGGFPNARGFSNYVKHDEEILVHGFIPPEAIVRIL